MTESASTVAAAICARARAPARCRWRAASDAGADYLVTVVDQYYELAKSFYMRGWSPERTEEFKKRNGIDML
jgi:hypothetical protein